ncbi:alanine racemase [Massilia sp. TN1-12]|uniref:alanine racemase n=1 Tax=Massilia paldalensis TaxID=3377675 RepID=UPI00384F0871
MDRSTDTALDSDLPTSGASDAVDLAARAGALLTVDLDAIRANYRLLRAQAGGALVAGIMKADAYGLGMARIAPVLAEEGCRVFFTAHLDEAIRLRPLVPADRAIYVLHGAMPGTAADFIAHGISPVLNDAGQAREWITAGRRLGRRLPAAIQVDTGMSRMGMSPADLALLGDPAGWMGGIEPAFLMSHLACADEADHPMNAAQLARFEALRARFPGLPCSLANSSGLFLGSAFHYDIVRPGAALYGINPRPGSANPMRAVAALQARIVQVRDVEDGTVVGYGARFRADGPRRIATIAIGYADGWLRALTNRGYAFVDGVRVPIAGTVSMDSITLDVSAIPRERIAPGLAVELLGPHQHVDEVAAQAGTIGYEVLTRLSGRFHRVYANA